jgi:N-dimethylarginine dimethylaminohydrolase
LDVVSHVFPQQWFQWLPFVAQAHDFWQAYQKKIITIKKTIPQQSNSVFCERTSLVSNKQALFSRVLL